MSIFAKNEKTHLRIEQLPAVNDVALALLEEYYEAIHVVQRNTPESTREMIREPGSGMWLAYLDSTAVGCVLLRRLVGIPSAGECKRLYVKPSVRGRHIANRMMNRLEEFARDQGMKWVYLASALVSLSSDHQHDRPCAASACCPEQVAGITYDFFRTFDLPWAAVGWYKQGEQDL
jgi:N-acetylglutamate synthase-like GNAT family acetyltransferase